ncbi:MAG: hypothetical protein ACI9TK_000775 [Flavobacteriaceae bacterium]
MKFKIVFYLFVFVCIILFFQLINTNKVLNYQDVLIQKQNITNLKLKDSIKTLNDFSKANSYFSLSLNNETNPDSNIVEESLVNALRAYNANGKLKILLPKIPVKGTFLIDHIKVINKQWILLGFKSDLHEGQALVSYKIKENNTIRFKEVTFYIEPL